MNDDRWIFLDTVRAALKKSDAEAGLSGNDLFEACPADEAVRKLKELKARTPDEVERLLVRLEDAAVPLNITLNRVRDEGEAAVGIAALVREKEPEWGTDKRVVAWRHPLVDRLDLPGVLAEESVPVTVAPGSDKLPDTDERTSFRRDVIDAFVGVTSADFLIADTATLVMKNRPGQPRSVSLVPMIHVAVITAGQVIENLGELYLRLQWDPEHRAEGLTNCMTFITGPSKTGDIELVMVHGAHGPRELHLFVIDDGDRP